MRSFSETIEVFKKLTNTVFINFKLFQTKQDFIDLAPYKLKELDYDKSYVPKGVEYEKFPGELAYSFELMLVNICHVVIDVSFINQSLVNYRSQYYFYDTSINEIDKLKKEVIIPFVNSITNDNPWIPIPGMPNEVVLKSYSDMNLVIHSIHSSPYQMSAISLNISDHKYSF